MVEYQFLHFTVKGVPQNHALAASWLRKAAETGFPPALNPLGTMYAQGQGVPQDYVQAHMWFNLAASRLNTHDEIDKAVANRDRIAAMMTPAQIAEAQKLAREWKSKTDAR